MRHDRSFLAIVVMQPMMLFLLFGFALTNKPSNVSWVVLDQDRSAASRRLVQEIGATPYFRPPQFVDEYDRGSELLRTGSVLAMVVIPSGFRREFERGRPQVQFLVDGSDPLSAAQIGGVLSQVATRLEIESGMPAMTPPAAVALRQQFRFNPALRERNFFLSALAGMLLTNLCLSVMGMGLVAEREAGTWEHILAQPTRPIEIILGKMLPHVGVCYVMLLFATLLPGLVFGLYPSGSLIALVAVTLPFVLATLGLGLFVSTLAQTSAQAVFLTVFVILPSFVLSGSMLPYELMPVGVRALGAMFPLRWYQIALRGVWERGAGLSEIAVPMAALTLMAVVVLGAAGWRLKPRLG